MALRVKIFIIALIILLLSGCNGSYRKNHTAKEPAQLESKEQAEIQSEYNLQNLLNYVVVASLAGIGVCAVLFLMKGSAGGLLGSVSAAVVLIIALAIKTFMTIFAIAGAILLVLMLFLMVVYVIRDQKAFSEVVETVEIAKAQIRDNDKLYKLKADANAIQSSATKKRVKKEKGE